MLSPRTIAGAVLLLVGILLGAGNIWFAAARSTIPLALDAQLVKKEIRQEKHPPKDSVHLLHFAGEGPPIHVDAAIFAAVEPGERLQKEAGERELRHDGEILALMWSDDFQGMLRAMPLLVLIMFATAWLARYAV